MSPRTLAVSGALLIALAVPAGAQAAVTVDPLDKPCYVTAGTVAPGRGVFVKAHGFTPNALVDVAVDGVVLYPGRQTDANGELGVLSPLLRRGARSSARAPASSRITLTEQGNPANTATVTSRNVALGVKVKPQQRAAELEDPLQGRGLHADKPVYAHYVYGGEAAQDREDVGRPERVRPVARSGRGRSPSPTRTRGSGPSSSTSSRSTASRIAELPERLRAAPDQRLTVLVRLGTGHATAGAGSAARARSKRSSPSAASTRTMSPAA